MEDIVTLTLPKGASAQFVRDIQDAVGGMEGVADSGELGTRGFDVQTIGVWVKVAGEPDTLHDRLMDVIRKLYDVVRAQGIDGSKITIGNIVIALADMKLDELERMIARLKATA